MEVTEERKIIITLTLKEAQFLRDLVQNPNCFSDNVEDDYNREMREIFWTTLNTLI